MWTLTERGVAVQRKKIQAGDHHSAWGQARRLCPVLRTEIGSMLWYDSVRMSGCVHAMLGPAPWQSVTAGSFQSRWIQNCPWPCYIVLKSVYEFKLSCFVSADFSQDLVQESTVDVGGGVCLNFSRVNILTLH